MDQAIEYVVYNPKYDRRFAGMDDLGIKQGESHAERNTRVGAEYGTVSGMIGYEGAKTHLLDISYVDRELPGRNPGEAPRMARVVLWCGCACGSRRWGHYGMSGLRIVPGREIDCQKCNR